MGDDDKIDVVDLKRRVEMLEAKITKLVRLLHAEPALRIDYKQSISEIEP